MKTILHYQKKIGDSYEISWDFEQHPLVKRKKLHSLEKCYLEWKTECENRFLTMKDNEEHMNTTVSFERDPDLKMRFHVRCQRKAYLCIGFLTQKKIYQYQWMEAIM